MNAALTSERLHSADYSCICQECPASPGLAHFFYQFSLNQSLYAYSFQQDAAEAPMLLRQKIWMVRPIEPFPIDVWALICIASTYSVDQIRKKSYVKRTGNCRQLKGYFQKQMLQLCLSVMTRSLHALEDGTPCMTSLHPLQCDTEAHRWRISPLLSHFIQA